MIKDDLAIIQDNLKADGISFRDKNILIPGGAGFLGSWICDYLVEDGANVTCLDNFSSGLESNISHLKACENFSFIKHDITNPIKIDKNLDIIFFLASRASPFEFENYPIQILKANTLGIWVALEMATQHKAKFIYTSTSEIYGNPDPKYIPTPESYNGNVNPVGPRSCYDEAKRAGEAFVKAYELQHGLDTRIVRIFNTYGPRLRSKDEYGRVISRFIDQALNNEPITIFGDGSQTRSFIYVTDEVEGILRLAMLKEAQNEIINIGAEKETSIIELAQTIKEKTGSASKISFHPLPIDDPERRSPDITKAKKILNWEPKVKLDQGIAKIISWFRAQDGNFF